MHGQQQHIAGFRTEAQIIQRRRNSNNALPTVTIRMSLFASVLILQLVDIVHAVVAVVERDGVIPGGLLSAREEKRAVEAPIPLSRRQILRRPRVRPACVGHHYVGIHFY